MVVSDKERNVRTSVASIKSYNGIGHKVFLCFLCEVMGSLISNYFLPQISYLLKFVRKYGANKFENNYKTSLKIYCITMSFSDNGR